MDDIEVREARPGDGAELARIWTEAARHYVRMDAWAFRLPRSDGLAEWFEEDLARPQEPREKTLVAELVGELAGFASGHVVDAGDDADRQWVADYGRPRLYVDVVATADRFTRRGVATRLIEALERWARGEGAEVALAETYAASPMSIPFWEERAGYERRSVRFVKRLR